MSLHRDINVYGSTEDDAQSFTVAATLQLQPPNQFQPCRYLAVLGSFSSPNIGSVTGAFSVSQVDSTGPDPYVNPQTITWANSGAIQLGAVDLNLTPAGYYFDVNVGGNNGTETDITCSSLGCSNSQEVGLPLVTVFNGSLLGPLPFPSSGGTLQGTAHVIVYTPIQQGGLVQAPWDISWVFSVGPLLSITTTSLPSTTSGVPYGAVALTATGGSGSYSWSATGLPPGFSISAGRIVNSCPAAPPKTYSVVLMVTDLVSGETASSAPLPLVVNPLAMNLSPLRINQGVDLVANGQVNITLDPNSGHADAMAGRATLVETSVQIPPVLSCMQSVQLPVVLTLEEFIGPLLNTIPQQETIAALQGNGKLQWFIDQGLPQSDTTQLKVTVTIDPNDTVSLGDPNEPVNEFEIIGVHPLGRPILYEFSQWGLGPVPMFLSTVTKSMNFLHGVYPIPEGNPFPLNFYEIGPNFFPDPLASTLAKQYDEAYLLASMPAPAGEIQPEKGIFIVPQSWFDTYYPNAVGVTYINGWVVFVQDGYYQVVAHELGHTYGFIDLYTLDSNFKVTYNGPPANPNGTGYWVQNKKAVPSDANDIMGAATGNQWICDAHYGALLQNFLAPTPDPLMGAATVKCDAPYGALSQNFLAPTSDPEVLLVTGTISQSGSVAFWKMYRNNQGRVTPNVPGDGLVQILGKNGAVLASVTFDTKVQPTDNAPDQPAREVPLAVALPFAGAFQVQVEISGKLTAQVNVATKLLVDAVNSIPDNGFVQTPSERRNALLNKIGALDSQLSAGAINGAVNKLQNDIEKSLQDWLVDGYTVQSPLQYTKDQVIALVNELIQQLG